MQWYHLESRDSLPWLLETTLKSPTWESMRVFTWHHILDTAAKIGISKFCLKPTFLMDWNTGYSMVPFMIAPLLTAAAGENFEVTGLGKNVHLHLAST